MDRIIGVLGSGRGTNFQAIINAINKGQLSAKVGIVISDVEDAPILERARKHGVKALYIPPGRFKTKVEPEIEKEYVRYLKEAGVQLVALAGFMRILKENLLGAFPGRIVNIHPSLLPAFKGLEAWTQAVDYGAKVSGCTVHFVDGGMDTGPIIMQNPVPVYPDDTPAALHARIQEQEHILYPKVVGLILDGKVRVEGRKVMVEEETSSEMRVSL